MQLIDFLGQAVASMAVVAFAAWLIFIGVTRVRRMNEDHTTYDSTGAEVSRDQNPELFRYHLVVFGGLAFIGILIAISTLYGLVSPLLFQP